MIAYRGLRVEGSSAARRTRRLKVVNDLEGHAGSGLGTVAVHEIGCDIGAGKCVPELMFIRAFLARRGHPLRIWAPDLVLNSMFVFGSRRDGDEALLSTLCATVKTCSDIVRALLGDLEARASACERVVNVQRRMRSLKR